MRNKNNLKTVVLPKNIEEIKGNEYKNLIKEKKIKEINASFDEKFRWKIYLFSKLKDKSFNNFLSFGEVVVIKNMEKNAVLSLNNEGKKANVNLKEFTQNENEKNNVII